MSHLNRDKYPLVSICLPVFNAEKTIADTLLSILGQTYDNMEVLVVDNASTDKTLLLVQGFDDARLKIYRSEVNVGAEKNFSKAVQMANGEFIALFHADDLYLPELVEKQVEVFQKNPDVGAVFTRAGYINSHGELIGESRLPSGFTDKESYCFPEIFEATLENLNFLICPSAMVRGKLYKELMPFRVERFKTASDLDMWFRIVATHPIAILPEKLMSYRSSTDQVSYQSAYLRTERADIFKVMDHYLSVQATADISAKALGRYELAKNIDRVRCAKNYLLKSQPAEAKKLLKETFSAKIFWGFSGAGGDTSAFKVLLCWLFTAISLVLISLGLGHFLGRGLQRLLIDHEEGQVHIMYAYAGKTGLFVDPSHEQFYDNELFNENSRWNRDGQFAPFILLKERLTERGICVYTADYLLKNKISFDINIYVSFGITSNYVNLLERRDIRMQSFYIMEPPVVAPQLYREVGNLARNFARVYLHNAEGIGYDRYFNGQQNLRRFFWPQLEEGVIAKLWENRNRGFLVMINSNKKAVLKENELYSKRIQALVQFQKLGPVDLYGNGWDAPFYRLCQARYIPFLYWKHRKVLRAAIYKGSVQSKYEALSRYHFALCFENMVMPGYITEKIFDCFFVGTVPVYLGAPDIDKYIPRGCFIDRCDFADYGQLFSFLQSLTEKDISFFREAAREYLMSSQYRPFTKRGFAEQFEADLRETLEGI